MLWRALKHVEHGFYIDVGAYSPEKHSVTKAFYDRGWRGINIEPHAGYHRAFLVERPLDINLNVAAGARAGTETFYLVADTGLSTLDGEQAGERVGEGREVIEETVRVEPLAAIWAEHVAPGHPVHFLKVDVEGFERQVLLGNDWARHRPWIVVVEATLPMTTEPSYETWESIVLDAGYEFAYRDGLNRFYVATEHAELAEAFETPPNVFDEFVRIEEHQAVVRATGAEHELAAIRATRSWRMTAPLRDAMQQARRIRSWSRRAMDRIRRVVVAQAGRSAATLVGALRSKPSLRRRLALLRKVPGVMRLYRRLDRESESTRMQRYELADLSPRAQRFYHALMSGRDDHTID